MDINEFSIACKLVNLKLRGFEIPKQLPPTMIASLKSFGTTPTLTPTGAGSLSPVTNIPPGKYIKYLLILLNNNLTYVDVIEFRRSSRKTSVTSAIASAATTSSTSSTYGHCNRLVSITYIIVLRPKYKLIKF